MKPCSGLDYYAALRYAYLACPGDEKKAELGHVAFIGDLIVAGDGERIHIGVVHGADFPRRCYARESVRGLLVTLEYARKASGWFKHTFEVKQYDRKVEIYYGADDALVWHLAAVDVGEMPAKWEIPNTAGQMLDPAPRVRSSHLDDVGSRKTWEDSRQVTSSAFLGGHTWVRYDITVAGEFVKVALLVPVGTPLARLPSNEPLLRDKTKRFGRSVLDLYIDPDGKEAPKEEVGDDEEDDSDEEDSAAPKLKKKRGRPKKVKAPEDEAPSADPEL